MFDKELQHLQDETLVLGSMVEKALVESVEVLKRRDMEGSRRLIAQDHLINKKRFAIENEALILIATQQPMAGDLRIIAAVLDITHELERIGDYAKGIAKINLMLGDDPLVKPLVDIPRMV
jgi:phosphate transport system protein